MTVYVKNFCCMYFSPAMIVKQIISQILLGSWGEIMEISRVLFIITRGISSYHDVCVSLMNKEIES